MSKTHVSCTINGDATEFLCSDDQSLLGVLRNEVGLTGVKEGCSTGDCGSCSVVIDDRLNCSCLVLAPEAEGSNLVTIEGLADGTIDAIATDHAPHAIADKLCEYDAAAYGISGFETALATVLTLVHSGRVPLGRAVAALTEGPARVLGSNGADLGTLKNGGLADVTILDPNREWVVDSQAFASMGKNTPLEGHTLRGRVVATVYGGVLVHDERAEAVGNG